MQEIINALSWTFIHSLWQGLAVALLAALLISITRKATARLRYQSLGFLLLLFVIATVITFIVQLNYPNHQPINSSFLLTGDITHVINNGNVLQDFEVWVNGNSNLLLFVWTFFFLFSSLRLVTGIAAVNRLRHYRTHPVEDGWISKLNNLKTQVGVRQSILLLQSELVKVPVALGIFKPMILIPIGLVTHLSPVQVETILLHELAHIKRRDYLINLLQHVIEALFFFNPAVRWLSSLLRQEREACCDDMVIACSNQKSHYLQALVRFQEYSLQHPSFAMGIGTKRQYLLNRVKRIMTNRNNGLGVFESICLIGSVVLFSAFGYLSNVKNEQLVVNNEQLVMNNEQLIMTGSVPVLENSRPFTDVSKIPVNTKKRKLHLFNTASVDTVPPRKMDSILKINKVLNKQSTPPKKVEKVKTIQKPTTLEEIEQIKKTIGEKKESIGVKKEQLKGASGKEKEKILDEIERERDEVEKKRDELNKKRIELQAEKISEQKQKVEIKNTESKYKIHKYGVTTVKRDINVSKIASTTIIETKALNAAKVKEKQFDNNNMHVIKKKFQLHNSPQLRKPAISPSPPPVKTKQ